MAAVSRTIYSRKQEVHNAILSSLLISDFLPGHAGTPTRKFSNRYLKDFEKNALLTLSTANAEKNITYVIDNGL
jgi:hypothetical protein